MSNSSISHLPDSCNSVASPKIRAIPTDYAGIRFRSRTEARWAAFFDALKVPWCYEDEGYELPDGTVYLPDFYIPRWDCTIEVKGAAEPDERTKCAVLSDCLNRRVVLLEGFPALGSYRAISFRPGWDHPCSLIHCQFAQDRRDDDVWWMLGHNYECACCLDKPKTDHDSWPELEMPELNAAYASSCAHWTDYKSKS
jgi:hypothetical protein